MLVLSRTHSLRVSDCIAKVEKGADEILRGDEDGKEGRFNSGYGS